MSEPIDQDKNKLLRQKIIGLGERSISKSYYPELRKRLDQLEVQKKDLEEERRKARESEANYRSVIENIQDVFYRSDARGNLIMASPSFLTLLGYKSFDECLGRSIAEAFYYYPEKRAEILAQIQANGSVTDYEVVLKRKDGTPVTVETNSHFYYDSEGAAAGVEGIFRDITDRKMAEEALRSSEGLMRAIVDGSPIPQFVIDKNHQIIHWNRALEEYSGLRANEMIGTNLQWRAFYSKERPCIADLIVDGLIELMSQWYAGKYNRSLLIEDAIEAMDFFPDMKSGTWLYFTAAPIHDIDGSVIGAVETLVDVTERKQAEESLRNSLAEKDVILRELYHRTKNNMQVICSMLNLKVADIKDAVALGICSDIQTKIQTMALVHQKLYESSDLSNINLNDYINSIVNLIMKNNELTPGKLTIHQSVDAIPISIDTAMPLGLVINELISNSIKHAFPGDRNGEIWIEMHAIPDEIKLEYMDNGIGLPHGYDPGATSTLGMNIIQNLSRMQLGGDIRFIRENGFGCAIKIKTNLYRRRV